MTGFSRFKKKAADGAGGGTQPPGPAPPAAAAAAAAAAATTSAAAPEDDGVAAATAAAAAAANAPEDPSMFASFAERPKTGDTEQFDDYTNIGLSQDTFGTEYSALPGFGAGGDVSIDPGVATFASFAERPLTGDNAQFAEGMLGAPQEQGTGTSDMITETTNNAQGFAFGTGSSKEEEANVGGGGDEETNTSAIDGNDGILGSGAGSATDQATTVTAPTPKAGGIRGLLKRLAGTQKNSQEEAQAQAQAQEQEQAQVQVQMQVLVQETATAPADDAVLMKEQPIPEQETQPPKLSSPTQATGFHQSKDEGKYPAVPEDITAQEEDVAEDLTVDASVDVSVFDVELKTNDPEKTIDAIKQNSVDDGAKKDTTGGELRADGEDEQPPPEVATDRLRTQGTENMMPPAPTASSPTSSVSPARGSKEGLTRTTADGNESANVTATAAHSPRMSLPTNTGGLNDISAASTNSSPKSIAPVLGGVENQTPAISIESVNLAATHPRSVLPPKLTAFQTQKSDNPVAPPVANDPLQRIERLGREVGNENTGTAASRPRQLTPSTNAVGQSQKTADAPVPMVTPRNHLGQGNESALRMVSKTFSTAAMPIGTAAVTPEPLGTAQRNMQANPRIQSHTSPVPLAASTRAPNASQNNTHSTMQHQTGAKQSDLQTVTPPAAFTKGRHPNVAQNMQGLRSSGNRPHPQKRAGQAQERILPPAQQKRAAETILPRPNPVSKYPQGQRPQTVRQAQPVATLGHGQGIVNNNTGGVLAASYENLTPVPQFVGTERNNTVLVPAPASRKPNFSEMTCSSEDFDELLSHFGSELRDGDDLHEQGDVGRLDSEVELANVYSVALRYRGEFVDLVEEIEDLQNMTANEGREFLNELLA